jgi:hypothetical protein
MAALRGCPNDAIRSHEGGYRCAIWVVGHDESSCEDDSKGWSLSFQGWNLMLNAGGLRQLESARAPDWDQRLKGRWVQLFSVTLQREDVASTARRRVARVLPLARHSSMARREVRQREGETCHTFRELWHLLPTSYGGYNTYQKDSMKSPETVSLAASMQIE